LAFFTQNKAKLCKNLTITLVFEKNANFSTKIADKCDHNIDPLWRPIQDEEEKDRSGDFLKSSPALRERGPVVRPSRLWLPDFAVPFGKAGAALRALQDGRVAL
jgi:hypothetical protein